MIDFELTEEQRLLAETVRQFAAAEFAPHIAQADREHHPIPDAFRKMAEIGLPGICFPQRYGGAGMDYISFGLACEELEYVDTSLRTVLSVHVGLCACGIYQWGTEEQRQRFLVPLARGEKMGAFGLTEPDAGSDVAGLATRVRRDGDVYVMNGQKIWISCAEQADTFLIFARLDGKPGHEGITAFVVERENAKGLSTFGLPSKAGIHAGSVGGIRLDDVAVPAANRLGEEGEGFKIAMSCLDNGRYSVAAGATGTIRASLDASVKYAGERTAFGQKIGRFQLVQEMIAKMVASYDACRLLWMRAGWLKNLGLRSTRESALAKWHATEAAAQAADDALEVHGAYGYSDEYPVARFWRNARGPVIYEGSREIQKLIQAEYALGYRRDKPLRCILPPYEEDGRIPEGSVHAVLGSGAATKAGVE